MKLDDIDNILEDSGESDNKSEIAENKDFESDNKPESAPESTIINKKKSVNKSNLFSIAFVICFVAFALLLLRILPLRVNSVSDIKSRSFLTRGVSIEVDPRKLYMTKVSTFEGEDLESYMTIYNAEDGKIIMLVPVKTIESMSMSGDSVILRGVIQNKPKDLDLQLVPNISSVYEITTKNARILYDDAVYVDARKSTQIPLLAITMLASIAFLALSFTNKKQQ